MAIPKIKLLQTVADIYNRGDIDLSASDRGIIEKETQDLIRKSILHRNAAKVPEGFEKILEELKEVKDADAAYEVIVNFLKENNIIKEDNKKDPDKNKDEDKDKDDKGKDEDKDDNGFPFDDKEAIKVARDGVINLAKKFKADYSSKEYNENKDEKDLKNIKDKDKDKSKNKDKLQKLQEESKDKSMASPDEMGLEKDQLIRAKSSKVIITSEGNITAHHVDYGPMFIGVPNDSIKNNKKALARLANRVKSLIIYNGWNKAAKVCGTKLIVSGVDEDIETTSGPILPETEPVTSGGDSDMRDEPEKPENNIIKELDTDTQEKPKPKMSSAELKKRMDQHRKNKAVARYEKINKSSGIADKPEVLTKEKPPQEIDELGTSVVNDADFDTKEDPDKSDKSTLDSGDVDFKTSSLEERYRKLYSSRAKKAVEKNVESFAKKLVKCIKIASTRMKLNHDDHRFKAAMVDVLTSNSGDIQFSNGDVYSGMNEVTAVELTELISEEGHDNFVNDLLDRAADLLEKDNKYLDDIESDIGNLIPINVNVEEKHTALTNNKASKARREMRDGNFSIKHSTKQPVIASMDINQKISDAISDSTKIGRKLSLFNR